MRQFSGLAQTGAWGCFDEFNRISIEVLSVIALTVSSLFNAIRSHAPTLTLDAHTVRLNPTMGLFITMNPGYAGRTVLPDNLSSLFRPVAMVAPDTEMIAEIVLQSCGFKDSAALGQKADDCVRAGGEAAERAVALRLRAAYYQGSIGTSWYADTIEGGR